MKRKNGFISTTVVYAFFFVFLTMLLFIITSYSNSRNLLKTMKNDVKSDISDTNFARYLINHYTELGLVNHTVSLTNGAKDNSYRYVGANPNNFVCFGSTATSCPNNNIYRIIGVIDGKVKLIKNDSLGNVVWDTENDNTWSYANIMTYLNTTYLNSLGTTYANLIYTNTWYVGGLDSARVTNVSNVYKYELGDNRNTGVTITNKIGLMYLSDYGYGATSGRWTTNLSTYNNTTTKNNNWLDNSNINLWTIDRTSNFVNQAYYVASNGSVGYTTVNNTYGVKPVFFLNGVVKRIGGTGTPADPYRLG